MEDDTGARYKAKEKLAMSITVKVKNVYGQDLIYPADDTTATINTKETRKDIT